MDRRKFIKSAGVIAAGSAVAHNLSLGKEILPGVFASEKKPNIIFILADDYGIGEAGCYGADNYKTPNIDKLAQGGVRFTHAYTPSLCGPSRACILTGRYAFRTGGTNQDKVGKLKPADETIIAKILKSVGYATTMAGKWSQFPLEPSDWGFDEYLRFQGSGQYWNTQKKARTYTVNGANTPLLDGEYLPDKMHNFVVDFITRYKDDPFFVYYSLSHIHGDILPTPESGSNSKDIYADNITYMDKLIGKLVAEIDRLRLREKTMIVFFGDNGTANKYSDRATISGRRLVGAKGSLLEGGSLEPLIINWPGTTPAGKVSDAMIDSTDFVPTFAEIASAQLPKDKIIDGRSFTSQIRGEKKEARDLVFIQLATQWYVRDKGWKLNQEGKLFDMSKAPFEEILVGVDSKDPEAVAARKRLQAALEQLNPAGGILDDGDGTGRHANKTKKKKKQTDPDDENSDEDDDSERKAEKKNKKKKKGIE
ncbi:MAG TPA: hypothetical protein DCQ28_06670 [Bacteroidetes bacterium]|nr:hypothetical protein [Bacteroidota bacterium]